VTSNDAIKQGFNPYPSTFPAIKFTVEGEIKALADYGYRTSDIEAELVAVQADQIIAQEAIA
jgi:hypothetical protein